MAKLRSNKKRLLLLISISLIIIGLIPHLILINISNSYYSYTIEPLSLESEDGTYISAFKYTPKGEKNHGGIVVGHYFTGNKYHMHPLSIELVKRGFTVINIDFRGHGTSGGTILNSEFINDMNAAVDYLEYNLPYITEIGLVGHSLGARIALALARAYPNRINATVAIGKLPSNVTGISNLLMAIGKFEHFVTEEDLLEALRMYTGQENVKIGEIYYGDFNGGNNTKGFIGSFSEHLFEVMDPSIVYQTVQWFEQAFNGGIANDIFITVPFFQIFSYISLFGIILLSFTLIVYLSNFLFKYKISYPEKELYDKARETSIYNLISYYAIYVILIGFLIFLVLSNILKGVISLTTTSLILTLTIGTAIGTLIIFNFLILHKQEKLSIKSFPLKIREMCLTNSRRSMIYGVLAGLLIIFSFAITWHWTPQNILPSLSEILTMIGIILISFPFFLIKEFYFRNVQGGLKTSNRSIEYFTMVCIGIFMDNFLIVMIKFFSWINLVYMPKNALYLSVWVVFSILQQFTTTWVYMWSGRNILGSTIFLSIFYAWMSIIYLPSFGFL